MKIMTAQKGIQFVTCLVCLLLMVIVQGNAQQAKAADELDKKVLAFLNSSKDDWRNWNVPYEDGKVLHDLILKNKYTSALEIGTSTGHSTVWLAWAMSKTGGKVITIEIDEGRYKTAKENIKKAGLEQYVDARLADAHELVKQLPGPFDFVFSDADKDWYTQYFIDVDPKLKPGGCFTAHNVSNTYGGAGEFLNHIKKLPNYTTTVDSSSSSGISISYKSKP
ncbi:MAG: class I SAM-dependent methyltransferase [Cyclobacteriaceae bacterium]|nr:class I SAM-dependent methyltransferase [Cyclobacteriaceae bacterium]